MYATSIKTVCIVLSVVVMTTFVTATGADIRPGDIVTVVDGDAKFMVGNDVVAELPKGTAIQVTKIQDNWLAGRVSLNGEQREGWIEQDRVQVEVITVTVVERYQDAPERWHLVARKEHVTKASERRPSDLRAEWGDIPPPIELSPTVDMTLPLKRDPQVAEHLQQPDSLATEVLLRFGEVAALPAALGVAQERQRRAVEPAADRRESGGSRHKQEPTHSPPSRKAIAFAQDESETGQPSAANDVPLSDPTFFDSLGFVPISGTCRGIAGDVEYWPMTLDEAIRTAFANARQDENPASTESKINMLNQISEVENRYWELYFAYRHCDAKLRYRDAMLRLWRELAASAGRLGAEDDKVARACEQYNDASASAVQARRHILATQRRLKFSIGLPINDDRLLRPAQDPSLAKVVVDWDAFSRGALANLYSSEPRLQYLPTKRRRQVENQLIYHLGEAISKVECVYELVRLNLDRRIAAQQRAQALVKQKEDRGLVVVSHWSDAQRQLEAAESDFFRHLAEYATSVKDVHLVAGCLPRYHNLNAAGNNSRARKAEDDNAPGMPSAEGPVGKGTRNEE